MNLRFSSTESESEAYSNLLLANGKVETNKMIFVN